MMCFTWHYISDSILLYTIRKAVFMDAIIEQRNLICDRLPYSYCFFQACLQDLDTNYTNNHLHLNIGRLSKRWHISLSLRATWECLFLMKNVSNCNQKKKIIWIFFKNKLSKMYFWVMHNQLHGLWTVYKEKRLYVNVMISFLHCKKCHLVRGNTYDKGFHLYSLVLFVPKTVRSTLPQVSSACRKLSLKTSQ